MIKDKDILGSWAYCDIKLNLLYVLTHLQDDNFCKKDDAIKKLFEALELVNEEEQQFYRGV